MYKKSLISLILILGLSAGAAIAAVPIEVINPSFELPGDGKKDIDQSGTVPGWAREDLTTSAGVELGWTPTDGTYTAFLGKGAEIFNLNEFLGMEGDQYRLIFDARSTWQGNNLHGQLYYDDEGQRNVFAEIVVDLSQYNNYETFVLETDPAGPEVTDHKIGIQFVHEYVPGLTPDDNIWAGVDYIDLYIISPLMRAQNPFPANESSYENTELTLTWVPGPNVPSVDGYNLFFSLDRDMVNQDDESANLGSTVEPSFDVSGLVEGMTYYWRVDTVSGADTYRGNIWSFTIVPLNAYDPSPADNQQLTSTDSVLSWQAGSGAVAGHVVIFGENADDVSNAPTATSGAAPFRAYLSDPATTSWSPKDAGLALETEKTYYWRIDEVESATTIQKGAVWSFTTVPIKGLGHITRELFEGIDGLIVSDLTSDPNFPDNPSTTELLPTFEAPHMAISNYGSRVYGWLYVREAGEYTFWIASGENSQLWFGDHPSSVSMIASVDSEDGREGWTQPREFDKYPEIQQSDPIYLNGGGSLYYIMALHKKGTGYDNLSAAWSGPDSNNERQIIPGSSLIPFDQVALVAAGAPNPGNNAMDVSRDAELIWIPGAYADKHDVYFGTSYDDVAAATTDNPLGVLVGQNQDANSYDPGPLEFNTAYYWRVDEVNDLNPDSPWPGNVWSFTVGNFIVVEDFESYTDFPPDEIWSTWIDGYGDATNGSTAGYPDPDFVYGEHYMETDIVHSGSQSMPLFYDNSAGLSEVTKTLTDRDWTQDGVVTLAMFYYGDAANDPEPMFVVLNGSAAAANDDASAALVTEWTRWDIPLQEFADQGVNLSNVSSISIGFGNRANPLTGGTGHVFFDDIRLYRE